VLEGPLHVGDRMVLQELQDAGVVLEAAAGAVLPLQGRAQFLE
jgi:ribosomal protein S19E (S16A)